MKSIARAGLAAILLLFASACNTDALPPAAGYADVTGTVTDAASKAPIAGATVTIDTVLSATTDANGKYTIKQVPSGDADYTVQADGYQVASSSASVEPGKPFELDIVLSAQTPH